MLQDLYVLPYSSVRLECRERQFPELPVVDRQLVVLVYHYEK